MYCKKCRASKIVKAGFVRGRQRYNCQECVYYFTEIPIRKHPFKKNC